MHAICQPPVVVADAGKVSDVVHRHDRDEIDNEPALKIRLCDRPAVADQEAVIVNRTRCEVEDHVNDEIPGLNKSVGLTLLEPHINYTKHVFEILNSNIPVKGIAHTTGGGLLENIPRIVKSLRIYNSHIFRVCKLIHI